MANPTTPTKQKTAPTDLTTLSPLKKHNKSNQRELAVMTMSFEMLGKAFLELSKRQQMAPSVDSIIPGSRHQLYPPSDGRISVDGVKVCYAYQLVALHKFGASGLAEVLATKDSQESPVISHLCGVQCITPDHIVIEPKQVNDERTHHHYCLLEKLKQDGPKGAHELAEKLACQHKPKCGAPLVLSSTEENAL